MNKTVLFVCVHNSGRSQIAAAFFKLMAKSQANAFSAGTQPADSVNHVVVEAMREVGIDISSNRPQMLTIDLGEKADRMITMGCGADAEAVSVRLDFWRPRIGHLMTLTGNRLKK